MTIGPRALDTKKVKKSKLSPEKTINISSNVKTRNLVKIARKSSSIEYNSGDEYSNTSSIERPRNKKGIPIDTNEENLQLVETLRDGSCLFRAFSYLLYGTQEKHAIVRANCVKYINLNWNFFNDFVTENRNSYVKRKSDPQCHGNHIEISAVGYLYKLNVQIFDKNLVLINTINYSPTTADIQIVNLRYNNNHYDALVHPSSLLNPSRRFDSPKDQDYRHPTNILTDDRDVIENSYLQMQLQQTDWNETEEQIIKQTAQQSLDDFYFRST